MTGAFHDLLDHSVGHTPSCLEGCFSQDSTHLIAAGHQDMKGMEALQLPSEYI